MPSLAAWRAALKAPQDSGCGSHGLAVASDGLKPNGRRVTLPRERDPTAVASRIDSTGPEEHRILERLFRQVLHLGQSELLALVDVDSTRQRQASAARPLAPGGCRARRRPPGSTRVFAANSNFVSLRPYRVTCRVTSWFDSTHVAVAPTGGVHGERRVDAGAKRARAPRDRQGTRS